jgi:hypothetical protein
MKKLFGWMFGMRQSPAPVFPERRSLVLDRLNPPKSELPPGVTIAPISIPERNSEIVLGYMRLILEHAEKLGLDASLRNSGGTKFVIGYIAGVVDAVCQQGAVSDEPTRIGMLEVAYEVVFLEGNRSTALDNFLKLQSSDEMIKLGVFSGGQDAFDLFDNEVTTFLHLYRYLAKEGDSSSSLQTAQKQR